jgi:protein gp37
MHTKIEWTRGDDGSPGETWNPVTGCTKVSAGCKNCYAERLAPRVFAGQMIRDDYQEIVPALPPRPRRFTDVLCHPERLDAPLHWRKPRRIFVNSMSDLFHEGVPDSFLDDVFAVMGCCEAPDMRVHTFQVLTKRPGRVLRYAKSRADRAMIFALPNLWLGVSVEDQSTADERIPLLLRTPAAVRFVSYEPALGPVNFNPWLPLHRSPFTIDGLPLINWIIAGGESGPHARPSHPDWFRSARDQCAAADVAYFFKQWGEYAPVPQRPEDGWKSVAAGDRLVQDDGTYCVHGHARPTDWELTATPMRRLGKKVAGRTLDGRLHDEYPA